MIYSIEITCGIKLFRVWGLNICRHTFYSTISFRNPNEAPNLSKPAASPSSLIKKLAVIISSCWIHWHRISRGSRNSMSTLACLLTLTHCTMPAWFYMEIRVVRNVHESLGASTPFHKMRTFIGLLKAGRDCCLAISSTCSCN